MEIGRGHGEIQNSMLEAARASRGAIDDKRGSTKLFESFIEA